MAINNLVLEKILKFNNDYEHAPLLYPQYPSDIPVFNKFPSPLYQIVYKVIFQTLLVIKFLIFKKNSMLEYSFVELCTPSGPHQQSSC